MGQSDTSEGLAPGNYLNAIGSGATPPKQVKATREGLTGAKTASGYVICGSVSFVALPARAALHRFVWVRNPRNGKATFAQVLDIGPWNIADDAYVFGAARPQAETGTDLYSRKTNGAGIDLGERVWADLEMQDNGLVEWRFL